MLSRAFAVLSALLLVASLAVATTLPPGLTLGQGLLLLDQGSPTWLREASPAWLWNWVEVPFMIRPIWLGPAFLGLICMGVAMSLHRPDTSPRRRRS